MAVDFGVLGEIYARADDRVLPIGHARQQCVLAVLLVNAGRAVSTSDLVDRVWGDHAPQRARETLQTYVSRLRQALGPALTRRPNGYLLAVDPLTVDLYRFRRLAEQARTCERYDEALALWRGEAFAALDNAWLGGLRETLHRERFTVELDRNDAALRAGRHTEYLDRMWAAVAAHPWDERLAGQVMLALYRCGRQSEALEQYRRIRRLFAEELGTDPGPSLRVLHQQILTADPALDRPVDGDVRSAPVPRQLPAAPALFTGRVVELAELTKVLLSQPERPTTVIVSAIGGAGGVGKTWLALRWAHDNVRHFPDGQLYVNLNGYDTTGEPVAPAVAVRGFLDALGVTPDKLPTDPGAQAALYRTLVADRRMLIVLDNARDTASVAPLLPGTPSCTVLVTSRHQLPGLVSAHGARPLPLGTLSPIDATDLLACHLGVERIAAEPKAATAILRECAGLPLALGIIAARAALAPEQPLAVLAAELHDATTRLDALDAGELTVNLRAVLAGSVRALPPDAVRVLGQLGLAPVPDLSLAAVASLTARPVADARRVLGRLRAAHLVHEPTSDRYRMHDLVRLYAAEIGSREDGDAEIGSPEDGDAEIGSREDGDPAVTRLLDHYLHTAHRAALLLSPYREPLVLPPVSPGATPECLPDLDAAMRWFTVEHPALLTAIRYAATAGYDRHACNLPWTLATFFGRRGHWADWLAAQQVAVAAADRLNDLKARAEARRLLANAYSNLRRYDDANCHLQQALALFTELGDEAACAHSHLDLALLADRHGRPREALPHAEQSLALYRAAGTPLQVAVALNAVGWYHAQLGEYREAIRYCREALALSEQIDDPYGQSNTLDSLGYAYHHLGEHDLAIDCYERAIRLFQQIGDRDSEGVVLDHLGDACAASGDPQRAATAWRAAADLLDQLANPGAAAVRAKLGTPPT